MFHGHIAGRAFSVRPGICGKLRDVQGFVDIRDVDFRRAWLAVAAVNAASLHCALVLVDHPAVIPLSLTGIKVVKRIAHLFHGRAADKRAYYRRPCQRIVDTLSGCQRFAERRKIRVQQFCRSQGFHCGNSDALLFAEPVQRRAVRIKAQPEFLFFFLFLKHRPGILGRRNYIKCGINAEHEKVYVTGFNDPACGYRMVGTCADCPDYPFFLQIQGVLKGEPVKYFGKMLFIVNEEKYSDIYIVRAKMLQQILKIPADGFFIPAYIVLLIYVGSADVPLDEHFIPLSPEGFPDIFAHFFPGHKNIQNIDIVVQSRADNRVNSLIRFFVQMLAAESDNTCRHSGFADGAVNHFIVHINDSSGKSHVVLFVLADYNYQKDTAMEKEKRKTVLDVFERRVKPDTVYDVIVCGGGPAGFGAALAAAMNGAKTAILESRSQFGGTATAAMWMEWNALFKDSDETDRGGINRLIVDELLKWGYDAVRRGDRSHVVRDHASLHIHPEYAKKVLFDLFERYEIDYQLYSPVVDTVKEGNRITGVIIGAKEGNIRYSGKVIIDATGDGDVAALAGCEMASDGEEQTGWRAPVTVGFAVGNVDTEKFFTWLREEKLRWPSFRPYKDRIHSQGLAKGYNLPEWIGFDETTVPGVVSLNNGTSKDLHADPAKSYTLTYIEKIAIDEALEFVRWARTERLLPGMENCYLLRTGGYAMARDTRRLVGEYVFTNEDVMNGSRFDDVVACKYGSSDPVGKVRGPESIAQGTQYPYRSMLPKEIDGLLVAGRCGSATLLGHYGGKSIGNMICIGQAAGVAASLCGKQGVQPRSLDYRLIQQRLREMGVSL